MRASVLKLGSAPSSGSRWTNVVTGLADCQPASLSSPSRTIAAAPAVLAAVMWVALTSCAYEETTPAQRDSNASTLRPGEVTTLDRRILRSFGLPVTRFGEVKACYRARQRS